MTELKDLLDQLDPVRASIKLFGKVYAVPRDQVGMSVPGAPAYAYSGSQVTTVPMTPRVTRTVELACGPDVKFQINRYKDGTDSVGWHADDEPCIDQEQPIASRRLSRLPHARHDGPRPRGAWTKGTSLL